MKTLLRTAASLAFLACFLAGMTIIIPALSEPKSDSFMLVAVGLLFTGCGIFFGAILLFAANRIAVSDSARSQH